MSNRVSIVERFVAKGKILEQDKSKLPDGVLCRVRYNICNIGKKNRNGRVYEKAVWDRVLSDQEILEKLRTRSLFAHAEHPESIQSSTEKVAAVVTEISINENQGRVMATLDVLDTPYGRIVDTLLRAGCGLGVSTRAEGELEEVKEKEGKYYRVVPETYRFITIDFTADPSTYGSYPESVERDVVNVVKQGIESKKIDQEYATVLLEKLSIPEAKAILETIKKNVGEAKQLPIVVYQGKKYYVDSRLEELRSVVSSPEEGPIETIPFDDIPEEELDRILDQIEPPKKEPEPFEKKVVESDKISVGSKDKPFVIKLGDGRTAKLWQEENGMYRGEIEDEDGNVVSATTAKTSAEVQQWIASHESKKECNEEAKFKVGDRVKVVPGSGLVSGRTAVVVDKSEIKLRGDGVPENVPGAYKPVDWSKEIPIKYDDGGYDIMFKDRLVKVNEAKDFDKDIAMGILARHSDSPMVNDIANYEYASASSFLKYAEDAFVNLKTGEFDSKSWEAFKKEMEEYFGPLDEKKESDKKVKWSDVEKAVKKVQVEGSGNVQIELDKELTLSIDVTKDSAGKDGYVYSWSILDKDGEEVSGKAFIYSLDELIWDLQDKKVIESIQKGKESSDYKVEITRKELEALKKKFDAENWSDSEFIEWYRRNHGTGYPIVIVDESKEQVFEMKEETLQKLKDDLKAPYPNKYTVQALNDWDLKRRKEAVEFIDKLLKAGVELKDIGVTDWSSAPVKIYVLDRPIMRFSDYDLENTIEYYKFKKSGQSGVSETIKPEEIKPRMILYYYPTYEPEKWLTGRVIKVTDKGVDLALGYRDSAGIWVSTGDIVREVPFSKLSREMRPIKEGTTSKALFVSKPIAKEDSWKLIDSMGKKYAEALTRADLQKDIDEFKKKGYEVYESKDSDSGQMKRYSLPDGSVAQYDKTYDQWRYFKPGASGEWVETGSSKTLKLVTGEEIADPDSEEAKALGVHLIKEDNSEISLKEEDISDKTQVDLFAKIKQFESKLAELKAEKEKILELVEEKNKRISELEEKYKSDVVNLNSELFVIQNKLKESLEQLDKMTKEKEAQNEAFEQVKRKYEEDIRILKEKAESEKSEYDKEIKKLVESHTLELENIKNQHKKELLKKYIETALKVSRLQLPKEVLPLVEQCSSEEEVDALFEQIRKVMKIDLLHSSKLTEVVVPNQQYADPKFVKLFSQISSIMSGMTGSTKKTQ